MIDLSGVETIDPFATCLLALYVRRCSEARGRARILLPEREEALRDRLAQALDRIRDRWSEGAIWRGSAYASKLLVEATGGMGRQKEIALEFKGRA